MNKRITARTIRRRIVSLPTLIAIAVGAATLILALWRLFSFEWTDLWANLQGIEAVPYILAAAFYYTSFLVRGMRWRLMANHADIGAKAKIPSTPVMSILIIHGWFLNAVAFLRMGDAYRAWALAREAKAEISSSLGTVAAERAQDILTVLILILIAALWITVADTGIQTPTAVITGAFTLAGLLGLGLVTISLAGKRLSERLPVKVRAPYLRFRMATIVSLKGRQVPPQLALGVIGWMLEVLRFHFVADAVGIEFSFVFSMIAALAIAMLTTIPTPGGFGFVETGLTGLLILLGVTNNADAVSLTVADRLISWISIIIFGGAAFFIWYAVKRRHGRTHSMHRKSDNITDDKQGL